MNFYEFRVNIEDFMSNEYIEKIKTMIESEDYGKIDLLLNSYFKEVLEEYNFNFVHNKIYSRKANKKYDENCKIIHFMAKGFNYRMKKTVSKNGKKLSELLHDAPNSLLLQYVSKPLLVHDILNYLHCYIYGLSENHTHRCVTASEYLKFEDMLGRWQEYLQKASK